MGRYHRQLTTLGFSKPPYPWYLWFSHAHISLLILLSNCLENWSRAGIWTSLFSYISPLELWPCWMVGGSMRGTRAGASTSLEKRQPPCSGTGVLRTCLPCAWAAFQRRGWNSWDILGPLGQCGDRAAGGHCTALNQFGLHLAPGCAGTLSKARAGGTVERPWISWSLWFCFAVQRPKRHARSPARVREARKKLSPFILCGAMTARGSVSVETSWDKQGTEKKPCFGFHQESPEGPSPWETLGRIFSFGRFWGGPRNWWLKEQRQPGMVVECCSQIRETEYDHHDHPNRPHFKACETIFGDEHPSASDFEVAHGKMDMIHSHMVRS